MMLILQKFLVFLVDLCEWIRKCFTPRGSSLVICVEGNIGSGKSTLIQNLQGKQLLGRKVVNMEEPISLWQDFCGLNMLDLYYSNRQKWGFVLQTFLQTSLLSHFLSKVRCLSQKSVGVMERSMISSSQLFIPMMKKQRIVNDVESWVASYQSDVYSELCPVDLYVYLRSEPSTCFQRVQMRGRREEIGKIDLDYLWDLHDFHEKWFDDIKHKKNVIAVDVKQLSENEVLEKVRAAVGIH